MQQHRAEYILKADQENSEGDSQTRNILDIAPHADKLDMNHVRIEFEDFQWGMLFIYTGTATRAVYGAVKLVIRCWLYKHVGWVRPTSRPNRSLGMVGQGTTDLAKVRVLHVAPYLNLFPHHTHTHPPPPSPPPHSWSLTYSWKLRSFFIMFKCIPRKGQGIKLLDLKSITLLS